MRASDRSRRFTMALGAGIGGALLALGTAAPAVAEPVPDSGCPSATPSGLGSQNKGVAQSFVAQTTGALVRGEFEIVESPATVGDFLMQVLTTDALGRPTTTALATTQIADPPGPAGTPRRIAGDFAIPASVIAGQSYGLSLRRVSSGNWNMQENNDQTCPGQEWQDSGLGTAWGGVGDEYDTVFQTFVEPPAEAPVLDTTQPSTSITGQPKAKTKKKQATFEFTSSEPGSSFECSLNGAPFVSCTSPHEVKGKKGKNHFEVRAKDAAGNTDPTPATFDWKVKKKKRR